MEPRKLIASLSPEETTELMAALPDEALLKEVTRRLQVPNALGATATQFAAEANPSKEVGSENIRRPIQKYEFMRYIDGRLAEGEKYSVRAQKGVISRVWSGFIGLHKTEHDYIRRRTNSATSIKVKGIEPPMFEVIVRDTVQIGDKKRLRINEDQTNGLDMDQAARYMIAISRRIRAQTVEQNLDKTLAADVIQRYLPQYSFVGCQLFCDFLVETSAREGGMPSDIKVDELVQVAHDFANLAGQQATQRVTLK